MKKIDNVADLPAEWWVVARALKMAAHVSNTKCFVGELPDFSNVVLWLNKRATAGVLGKALSLLDEEYKPIEEERRKKEEEDRKKYARNPNQDWR